MKVYLLNTLALVVPLFAAGQQQHTITAGECEGFYQGTVVGDPGDGSVSGNPNYICGTNNMPPLAIVFEQGYIEPAVCCGRPILAQLTSAQCQSLGGSVVGDIGNGAIFSPDYRCESNGEPVLGRVTGTGSIEGAVCCGPANGGPAGPTPSPPPYYPYPPYYHYYYGYPYGPYYNPYRYPYHGRPYYPPYYPGYAQQWPYFPPHYYYGHYNYGQH